MEKENAIRLFENKKVRVQWDEKEKKWYFSIVDILAVLTEKDFQESRNYWKVLKHRLKEEGNETVTNCNRLKMYSSDGKMRFTDVGDTEQIFRLIQSIPSKKAEPFKQWLAKVGYERVQEIENPELAQERMKELYREKGYSDEWIEKRVRGMAVRQELTDEWKERGVKENLGFAILTNQITKATFGKDVEEYKRFKNLKSENLRDHMDDTELILTMLGENVTTRLTRERDSRKFKEMKKDADDGGNVAGETRRNIEKQLGAPVSTSENYIDIPEKEKRKRVRGFNDGKVLE